MDSDFPSFDLGISPNVVIQTQVGVEEEKNVEKDDVLDDFVNKSFVNSLLVDQPFLSPVESTLLKFKSQKNLRKNRRIILLLFKF